MNWPSAKPSFLKRGQRQAQAEKLDALATLAAGAAHELASPLSTIAVLARDLELSLASGVVDDEAAHDMQLIRTEVARCRKILDSMASRSGENVGEEFVPTLVADLLAAVVNELAAGDRIDLVLAPPSPIAAPCCRNLRRTRPCARLCKMRCRLRRRPGVS